MRREAPDCSPWFGTETVAISRIGSTGFSGSCVFLVRRGSGARFVLKSFSVGMPPAHPAWVHGLMRHLRAAGVETVPDVVALQPGRVQPGGSDGTTLATDPAGVMWELVEFVGGSPRAAPTAPEAAAALAGLACVHAAAATLPCSPPRVEPSPGVARRVEQARRMLHAPWRALGPSDTAPANDAIRGLLAQAVEVFETQRGRETLDRVAATVVGPMPMQAVLRDVWSEHVLFEDDGRLAGFIDYHAAGRDTPATDLARLLGSWDAVAGAGASLEARWSPALRAYEAVRPLTAQERRMIPWLHATAVICGLDNWFRWLFTDRRRFDDMRRVMRRIDRLIHQLPDALEAAQEPFAGRD